MISSRISRVNHLIQQELSQIILRELDFPSGSSAVLITLTRVETSGNLFQSKIYISVLPEKKIKEILQMLNRQIYQLQQKLNKRLKMRPVPRISFLEEKKTSEAGRVEEILEKIKSKRRSSQVA